MCKTFHRQVRLIILTFRHLEPELDLSNNQRTGTRTYDIVFER